MSLIYADMRECQDHLLARFMAGTTVLELLHQLGDEEHIDEVCDGLDSLWDLMDEEQRRLGRLHGSNLNILIKGKKSERS